jgi:sigma-B regulation protein RsbU (phosphoserine phosphatase)
LEQSPSGKRFVDQILTLVGDGSTRDAVANPLVSENKGVPVMSILVVDDSEFGREIIEAVLIDAGYQDVTTVNSAAAAFSFLALDAAHATEPPAVDLMLLDIVMPDMNGIQACARIRSDSRYADIPIVMTSSLDNLESVDDALKCGATDYLTKPLKAVDLVACVRSKLKLKADIDKRNAREREMMQHVPIRF